MPATRVALIQMSCEASTEANLAKAVARVREAAQNGARLICLPELFRAQYFCQREDHALFDVDDDPVAVAELRDWAAASGFGRNMPDHEAIGRAGKSPVGQQRDIVPQPCAV